ncbi:MAG: hypothetical protein IPP57_24125 [Candidatus Obscuribacter sp.]|jgi:uncharacterized membrane protein YvlD (DUF360 family)|nr:hypothetical protein [Candidatus Obscuribacter sp.]MBK7839894.1 hypothetical protein [Candidatus Obscuribacter sp.]MBK9621464.1 hypothetical protein [Candidatus Obscuribacter sp.]MBK9773864.1 hypothetical protein [Candidatus Obscuribacter sp.]MBL0186207.1 hypothetical protein [Candidatus Obscuribacter sp.]
MSQTYLVHMLVQTLLLTLSLMFVVPMVTDGGVAVRRNSFFRGALGIVVLALGNKVLWHVLTVAGAMQAAPAVLFSFGIAALLVNAVVMIGIGRILPGVLYVRSFGTALGGSLALMLCGWLINAFV